MPALDEKIPGDFVPPLTRREAIAGWFWVRGEAFWLRRVRWRNVAGLLLGAAVAGYLALATGAFLFVRYARDMDAVGWSDIAWPPHWGRYRVARGEKFHAEAKKNFDAGMWREAFLLARQAVALAPHDRDGRLLLTKLLFEARRPVAGREMLLAGLRHHHNDPVFLREVFSFLFHAQEDAHVIAIARRRMQSEAGNAEVAGLCAVAGATASFLRGNYDQAEDFLHAVPGLVAGRSGQLLLAKIEWERGYRDLGLLQLQHLATRYPSDAEIQHELVSHLRRMTRVDEARRATLNFQLAHPHLPAPRIALLHAYRALGDELRLRREADDFLQEFADDERALLALADFAANTGDVAIAEAAARCARERKLTTEPFAFAAVEAALVAKDYRRAIEGLSRLKEESSEIGRRQEVLLDSLQTVAHFGVGDLATANVYLANYLSHPNLRAETLVALANRFVALEVNEAAQKVLTSAITVDAQNQAALTRLVELELDTRAVDAIPRHVRQLLKMRRPSLDLLRVAEVRLGSDLFVFSAEAMVALDEVQQALQVAKNRAADSR